MESSCDDDGGGVPRGTVGAEGDELEEDGGVVYIAEDILYSGSEDCSAADSYQVVNFISLFALHIFFSRNLSRTATKIESCYASSI